MFTNHVPYRPKVNKPTPAKKYHRVIEGIFKKLFRVTMKARDVISIAEQKELGVLSSGDKKIDKALAESQTPVLITINDMVEYYREGVPFRLTKSGDSKIIYELITEHTSRWRNVLRHAMNVGDAPVEDLILMEKFVATIYESAKFKYSKKPEFNAAVGSLGQFLYSGSALRGTTYVNNKLMSSTEVKEDRDVRTLQHNQDIDVFKNAVLANMRNRPNAT